LWQEGFKYICILRQTSGKMNKSEIVSQIQTNIDGIIATAEKMPDELFFKRFDEKWSVAENLQHLTLAVKPLFLAFNLPKFVPRLLFGKPNRSSRTYEEIVEKYQKKLADGAKASAAYQPKIKTKVKKTLLINDFKATYSRFSQLFAENFSEMQLDNYLLPHPILGKITVREMLYFTTYHILHHHHTIQKNAKNLR
jgi:DinB superfamily